VLNSDYIRAARLKGLPPRIVLWRHVLRQTPCCRRITIVALDVGYLLGGNYRGRGDLPPSPIGRQLIVAMHHAPTCASIQAGAVIMAATLCHRQHPLADHRRDVLLIDRRIRYD